MAIKHKRSSTAGAVPAVGDLVIGQLAMNTRDAILFMKKAVGAQESIVRVGAEMSAPVAAALKEPTGAAFLAALGGAGAMEYISGISAVGALVEWEIPPGYRDITVVGVGITHAGTAGTRQMQVVVGGQVLSTQSYIIPAGTLNAMSLSDSTLSARSFMFTIHNAKQTHPVKPVTVGTMQHTPTNWCVGIETALPIDFLRFTVSGGQAFNAGTFHFFGRR